MLISTPEILTAEELFGAYRVTPADRARYARMIAAGERDEATEDFILTYIAPYAEAYADQLLVYLRAAAEGEIKSERRERLSSSVTDLTLAAATAPSSDRVRSESAVIRVNARDGARVVPYSFQNPRCASSGSSRPATTVAFFPARRVWTRSGILFTAPTVSP